MFATFRMVVGPSAKGARAASVERAGIEAIDVDAVRVEVICIEAVGVYGMVRDVGLQDCSTNKGAVGTACRFHGTTIAFVGAHLNSDKRGVSKLEKRIRDTRYVCEGIELGFDALGFGLEACVHHVILLGDLNFRVGLPLGTALASASS